MRTNVCFRCQFARAHYNLIFFSHSYDNSWDSNVKQRSGWADHDKHKAGSTRMKGKHFRGLMAFERLIHPYTLAAVGAVSGLVYLGMSTLKKKDKVVDNGVNAW